MKKTETGNQIGKEGCNTHTTFSAKEKVNCSENIRTYYKATVRANHVPCSVVLHQDGIRVIGALNSWKAQSISTTEAKQQLNDHNSSKNMKNKNSNWRLNLTEQYPHGVKFFVWCFQFNKLSTTQRQQQIAKIHSLMRGNEPPIWLSLTQMLALDRLYFSTSRFFDSVGTCLCLNSSIQ